MLRLAGYLFALAIPGLVYPQSKAPTAAESLKQNFNYINQKILVMAQDFPESKYGYRLKPEMRSFRELIVHIASGNAYAAKAGRARKSNGTS